MIIEISYIIFYIQCIVGFFSFLFSLRLVGNNKIPEYMKGFYLYPTVGLLVCIPLFLNASKILVLKGSTNIINNISLIFHFTFLGIFIIKVLSNQKKVKFEWGIFYIFLSTIIVILFTNDLTKQLNIAFSVSNLGLSILCILYYYRLFNNPPIIELRKEPAFWIITGIFFCMTTHIPISAIVDYLKNKVSLFIITSLKNIVTFCFIIMHLFFIKAYLCATRLQKV